MSNQQAAELRNQMDEFTKAYVAAALWSSTVMIEGEPVELDRDHSIDDVAPGALRRFITDCNQFQIAHVDLLVDAYAAYREMGMEHSPQARAGHDFWLTRNRHGAGFWDRGFGRALATDLTEACHAAGEVELEIGDDGLIYQLGAK